MIPLHPNRTQEDTPEIVDLDGPGLGGRLRAELVAARAAAEAADWAQRPMTPVLAALSIAPRPGEYSGRRLAWLGLSLLGLLRLAGVSFGHAVVRATDTRMKAGVAFLIIAGAALISWVVGALT